jgi:hypothetical protein
MIMHGLRTLIPAALICVCVALSAHATPVTYYFEGSIYSGSLSFDSGTISNVIFQETGYPDAWVQVIPPTGDDVELSSPSLQFPSAPSDDIAGISFTDSTFLNAATLDGIHTGYATVFSDVYASDGHIVDGFEDEVLTLTPPTTAVPEASSLVLLFGSIFALCVVRLTSLLRCRTSHIASSATFSGRKPA